MLLAAGMLLTFAPVQVFAANSVPNMVSDSLLTLLYYNGSYYYNPDGNEIDCDSGVRVGGNQITLIGDSLSVGAIKQISNKLPGIDYKTRTYDGVEYKLIQESKHFEASMADNIGGIPIAKALKEHGELKEYLIFALGTNDPGGVTKDMIEKLVDTVGKGQKIVLVTNASDGQPGAPNYTKNNEAIRNAADTNENIEVADWAEVVGNNSNGYISDSANHVHLSENGNKAYAQVLYDGVYKFSGFASSGGNGGEGGGKIPVGNTIVSGNSAEEVVWNWLTTNIPSLTAEQKAAIMGNIQGESSFNPFAGANGGPLGIFQMLGGRRTSLENFLREHGITNLSGVHSKEEIYKALCLELEHAFTQDQRAMETIENFYRVDGKLSGEEAVKAYSDIWVVHMEGAVNTERIPGTPLAYPELVEWSGYYKPGYWGNYYYQGAEGRRTFSVQKYIDFGNGTGGGASSDICNTSGGAIYDVDGYTFPILGATKANYLQPGGELYSVLSRIPCPGRGCHHDYPAVDMGIDAASIGIVQDPNELNSGYNDYYYYSMGAKVVAPTNGKFKYYNTYSKAVGGYQDRCASITFEADDGTTFWLGHMAYDPAMAQKARDGVELKEGEVIGEIGPPQCAIGTQSHLHIQIGTNSDSSAPSDIYPLIDKLWEAIPEK